MFGDRDVAHDNDIVCSVSATEQDRRHANYSNTAAESGYTALLSVVQKHGDRTVVSAVLCPQQYIRTVRAAPYTSQVYHINHQHQRVKG